MYLINPDNGLVSKWLSIKGMAFLMNNQEIPGGYSYKKFCFKYLGEPSQLFLNSVYIFLFG